MKKIKLFSFFFSGNIIKTLCLITILGLSLIMMSDHLAFFRYNIMSASYINSDYFKNAIYVQVYNSFLINYQLENQELAEKNIDEYNKTFLEKMLKMVDINFFEKSKTYPAVEDVYGYSYLGGTYDVYTDDTLKICFGSENTYRAFKYPLSSGTWFDAATQKSEYPNAVVCGYNYNSVRVGDDIEIQLYDVNDQPDYKVKVHVIGKIAAPYYNFQLGGAASDVEAFAQNEALFTSNSVFLLDNELSKKQFTDFYLEHMFVDDNFIVRFRNNASQDEIKEYLDFIGQYSEGSLVPAYFNVDDVVKYTNEAVWDAISEKMPSTVMYIAFSTLSMLIIVILMVRKNMNEHYIYYLCGCSRKKSFGIMISGILSIGLISALIASGYILYRQYVVANEIEIYSQAYFDSLSIIAVFGYVILITVIGSLIPFLLMMKNTPIEMYRKRTN